MIATSMFTPIVAKVDPAEFEDAFMTDCFGLGSGQLSTKRIEEIRQINHEDQKTKEEKS